MVHPHKPPALPAERRKTSKSSSGLGDKAGAAPCCHSGFGSRRESENCCTALKLEIECIILYE